MKRQTLLLLASIFLCVHTPMGFAREAFMKLYREDPFSRMEMGYACTVCHLKGAGGGPLNPLGQAFDAAGKKVTPELRTRFPQEFSSTAVIGDDVEITFSKAHDGVILVKKGDAVYRLDAAHHDLAKLEAAEAQAELKAAEQGAKQEIAATPKPRQTATAKDPYPLPFEFFLGDLPTTRPSHKGDLHFRGMHRFTAPAWQEGRDFNMFGTDSFAYTGVGFSYGITNWLTAGIYRSSLAKTVEFNADFHIAEQRPGGMPFSFVTRFTMEGQSNFHEFYTPSLQFVFGRTVTSRAAFFFVPTFSFNTDPLPREDSPNNSTIALGIGASLKVLPRLSLIGEYIPRPYGYFDPFLSPKPTVSYGVQFRTFRHDFALMLSNAWGTTTSSYVQGGQPTFSVGFNIYRQLRQGKEQ